MKPVDDLWRKFTSENALTGVEFDKSHIITHKDEGADHSIHMQSFLFFNRRAISDSASRNCKMRQRLKSAVLLAVSHANGGCPLTVVYRTFFGLCSPVNKVTCRCMVLQ